MTTYRVPAGEGQCVPTRCARGLRAGVTVHERGRVVRVDGDDSLVNTVALCPNCHRKMHILDQKSDIDILRYEAKIQDSNF